ncbi:uncharacterized protein LOC122809238 [Protopterus annectens]|uniref:uncharacterized protein LOC122809238 n=1 Tax=Protopterus annectens TaxID=7888 RepID=UPI001CF99CC7|nr:uncharacterized protein LOC122809238 [Protopterus annectens]XP_043936488.1 uncharacterized protein LOC122809238 [Protopterus annectens]
MEFEVGAEVEVKEEISLEGHCLILEAITTEMDFEVGAELELKEDIAEEHELILENNPNYFSWDSVVSDESSYEDETPYEYFSTDSSDMQNFDDPRQNSTSKNKKKYTYKNKKKYGFKPEYKIRCARRQETKVAQCHFCGRNCVCIEYLNMHLEGYHAIVRVPVKCPCGVQLDTLNSINSHFASCRMMSFGCAWCEQSFHSLSELNVHWNSHNQPDLYSERFDFDLKTTQPLFNMLNHHSQPCKSPQNNKQSSQLQNNPVHDKGCKLPAIQSKHVNQDYGNINTVTENPGYFGVDQGKVYQKAGTFMPIVTSVQKSCGSQVSRQSELDRNFLITRITSGEISKFFPEGILLTPNELPVNSESDLVRYCPVCQINFLTGKDELECVCISCCEPLVEGFCLSVNEGSPPPCDQQSEYSRQNQENQHFGHLPHEKSFLPSAGSETSSVQVDTEMNLKFYSVRKRSDFDENTCSFENQADTHFISVGLSEAEISGCKKVHYQGQHSTDENSVWTPRSDCLHKLESDVICKNEPEDHEAFSTNVNTSCIAGCHCHPEREEHMMCKTCKASLSKGTYRLSPWLITVHFCQNCKGAWRNKNLELLTLQKSFWKPLYAVFARRSSLRE